MAYATIDKGSKYFNTITYTGTGASLANTGVGFQPDWVWIKGRSGATDHALYDAVRGVTKQIESNNIDPETTEATGLTAFGTDGFTVGALAQLNTSAATYVAWNWLGANTTASNTSGSITSTVSANTTSGFSIVSYTGTGALATVGHGLGVAPKFIIIKNRTAINNAWRCYQANLFAANASSFIDLQNTAAVNSSNAVFNSTAPTSSVFTVLTNTEVNQSGQSIIAYCFADVKGFSKFGSYTGNGSTDGTFVYTGFKPAFLMVKRSDSGAESWYMTDNKRGTYNLITPYLTANEANAEGTANMQDYLSNGFKIRGSGGYENASGGTYIYMAFAENPFVTSGGIPVTAR